MNAENMFIKYMYSVLCHIELIALFEKGLWYLFDHKELYYTWPSVIDL